MYDFIGIGAGPANLSLAIQALESGEASHNFLIVEKEQDVRWHPGMMLPGCRLDTHFAKDLITMLNPKSEFTFLNFLSEKNRLADFLNCGTPHPYREEFDEYIGWAANKMSPFIAKGREVIAIESIPTGGFCLHCKLADGEIEELTALNVVIGAGGKPNYICGLNQNSPNIIHSSDFMNRRQDLRPNDPNAKIIVVGSGQSAGELIQYLLRETVCDIHVSLADFALLAKEGTAFINESYNGDFVDRFYNLNPDMRAWFKEKRQNMNYGVVDSEILNSLYNDHYYQKHFNNRSITFRSFTRVEEVLPFENFAQVKISNHETETMIEERFDHVVLATGYTPSFDKSMIQHLLTESSQNADELAVNRDFSLSGLSREISGQIYMNGNVSDSHGPAEDVLSVISHRSRDILKAIETASIRSQPSSYSTLNSIAIQ